MEPCGVFRRSPFQLEPLKLKWPHLHRHEPARGAIDPGQIHHHQIGAIAFVTRYAFVVVYEIATTVKN